MFWKRRTYFDYASGVSANPSSPHTEGREAKKTLEKARTMIARLVEVQPDDVIFTSGATEANALAILGILKKGDHAFYLPSAHASVVENMKLASERGTIVETLPIKDGHVDCEELKIRLRPQTRLVVMDAVCGETGIVWNTRDVRQTIGAKVLLHVDASQAPLTEKITRAHFGADMLTFDAAKVGTMRGIGALVAHRTISILPLYAGGGQERGLRSGSQTPELAMHFATALCATVRDRETFRTAAKKWRGQLIAGIKKNIPNVYINEGRAQVPHILNLSLPGRDTDYLIALLDEEGFAVSSRSACETDSEEGSRAVYALSGDKERARATLRVSWGPSVSPHDFNRFVSALMRAVAFIDNDGQG